MLSKQMRTGPGYTTIALAVLGLALPGSTLSAGTMDVGEAMSLMSTLEGWHNLVWGIQENVGYDLSANLAWDSTYSSSGATFSVSGQTLNGQSFSGSYTGTLSGAYGDDHAWLGTWTGAVGSETFSATDTATWLWDDDDPEGGYLGFDFAQDGTLSSAGMRGAVPWYIRAAEIAGGAAAGIITKNIRSGISAGTSLWTLSDLMYADEEPPPQPARPEPPTHLPLPVPGQNKEWIWINGDNNLVQKIQRNQGDVFFGSIGSWDGGSAAGTTTMPEPTTLSLLLVGGLVALRQRGKRRV